MNQPSWISIVPTNFPSQILTAFQCKALINKLKEAGDKCDVKPGLLTVSITIGWLRIKCLNQEAIDWVRRTVKNLEPLYGYYFKIIFDANFPSFYGFFLAIPVTASEKNKIIKKILISENPDLACSTWDIACRENGRVVVELGFLITKKCVAQLKKVEKVIYKTEPYDIRLECFDVNSSENVDENNPHFSGQDMMKRNPTTYSDPERLEMTNQMGRNVPGQYISPNFTDRLMPPREKNPIIPNPGTENVPLSNPQFFGQNMMIRNSASSSEPERAEMAPQMGRNAPGQYISPNFTDRLMPPRENNSMIPNPGSKNALLCNPHFFGQNMIRNPATSSEPERAEMAPQMVRNFQGPHNSPAFIDRRMPTGGNNMATPLVPQMYNSANVMTQNVFPPREIAQVPYTGPNMAMQPFADQRMLMANLNTATRNNQGVYNMPHFADQRNLTEGNTRENQSSSAGNITDSCNTPYFPEQRVLPARDGMAIQNSNIPQTRNAPQEVKVRQSGGDNVATQNPRPIATHLPQLQEVSSYQREESPQNQEIGTNQKIYTFNLTEPGEENTQNELELVKEKKSLIDLLIQEKNLKHSEALARADIAVAHYLKFKTSVEKFSAVGFTFFSKRLIIDDLENLTLFDEMLSEPVEMSRKRVAIMCHATFPKIFFNQFNCELIRKKLIEFLVELPITPAIGKIVIDEGWLKIYFGNEATLKWLKRIAHYSESRIFSLVVLTNNELPEFCFVHLTLPLKACEDIDSATILLNLKQANGASSNWHIARRIKNENGGLQLVLVMDLASFHTLKGANFNVKYKKRSFTAVRHENKYDVEFVDPALMDLLRKEPLNVGREVEDCPTVEKKIVKEVQVEEPKPPTPVTIMPEVEKELKTSISLPKDDDLDSKLQKLQREIEACLEEKEKLKIKQPESKTNSFNVQDHDIEKSSSNLEPIALKTDKEAHRFVQNQEKMGIREPSFPQSSSNKSASAIISSDNVQSAGNPNLKSVKVPVVTQTRPITLPNESLESYGIDHNLEISQNEESKLKSLEIPVVARHPSVSTTDVGHKPMEVYRSDIPVSLNERESTAMPAVSSIQEVSKNVLSDLASQPRREYSVISQNIAFSKDAVQSNSPERSIIQRLSDDFNLERIRNEFLDLVRRELLQESQHLPHTAAPLDPLDVLRNKLKQFRETDMHKKALSIDPLEVSRNKLKQFLNEKNFRSNEMNEQLRRRELMRMSEITSRPVSMNVEVPGNEKMLRSNPFDVDMNRSLERNDELRRRELMRMSEITSRPVSMNVEAPGNEKMLRSNPFDVDVNRSLERNDELRRRELMRMSEMTSIPVSMNVEVPRNVIKQCQNNEISGKSDFQPSVREDNQIKERNDEQLNKIPVITCPRPETVPYFQYHPNMWQHPMFYHHPVNVNQNAVKTNLGITLQVDNRGKSNETEETIKTDLETIPKNEAIERKRENDRRSRSLSNKRSRSRKKSRKFRSSSSSDSDDDKSKGKKKKRSKRLKSSSSSSSSSSERKTKRKSKHKIKSRRSSSESSYESVRRKKSKKYRDSSSESSTDTKSKKKQKHKIKKPRSRDSSSDQSVDLKSKKKEKRKSQYYDQESSQSLSDSSDDVKSKSKGKAKKKSERGKKDSEKKSLVKRSLNDKHDEKNTSDCKGLDIGRSPVPELAINKADTKYRDTSIESRDSYNNSIEMTTQKMSSSTDSNLSKPAARELETRRKSKSKSPAKEVLQYNVLPEIPIEGTGKDFEAVLTPKYVPISGIPVASEDNSSHKKPMFSAIEKELSLDKKDSENKGAPVTPLLNITEMEKTLPQKDFKHIPTHAKPLFDLAEMEKDLARTDFEQIGMSMPEKPLFSLAEGEMNLIGKAEVQKDLAQQDYKQTGMPLPGKPMFSLAEVEINLAQKDFKQMATPMPEMPLFNMAETDRKLANNNLGIPRKPLFNITEMEKSFHIRDGEEIPVSVKSSYNTEENMFKTIPETSHASQKEKNVSKSDDNFDIFRKSPTADLGAPKESFAASQEKTEMQSRVFQKDIFNSAVKSVNVKPSRYMEIISQALKNDDSFENPKKNEADNLYTDIGSPRATTKKKKEKVLDMFKSSGESSESEDSSNQTGKGQMHTWDMNDKRFMATTESPLAIFGKTMKSSDEDSGQGENPAMKKKSVKSRWDYSEPEKSSLSGNSRPSKAGLALGIPRNLAPTQILKSQPEKKALASHSSIGSSSIMSGIPKNLTPIPILKSQALNLPDKRLEQSPNKERERGLNANRSEPLLEFLKQVDSYPLEHCKKEELMSQYSTFMQFVADSFQHVDKNTQPETGNNPKFSMKIVQPSERNAEPVLPSSSQNLEAYWNNHSFKEVRSESQANPELNQLFMNEIPLPEEQLRRKERSGSRSRDRSRSRSRGHSPSRRRRRRSSSRSHSPSRRRRRSSSRGRSGGRYQSRQFGQSFRGRGAFRGRMGSGRGRFQPFHP